MHPWPATRRRVRRYGCSLRYTVPAEQIFGWCPQVLVLEFFNVCRMAFFGWFDLAAFGHGLTALLHLQENQYGSCEGNAKRHGNCLYFGGMGCGNSIHIDWGNAASAAEIAYIGSDIIRSKTARIARRRHT